MSKVIFFDFDGVILDSMSIKDIGFEMIAKKITDSNTIIKNFIEYHKYNAGLSRYVKIRYLYEEMLGKKIEEGEINILAEEFSSMMRAKLINKDYLIEETVEFIKANYKNIIMHIVSGTEENELNFICSKLGIAKYFKTINGSPVHKNYLVKHILFNYNYNPKKCILIGDSINDYTAARLNNINFYAYNNLALKHYDKYIDTFKNFEF